MSERNLLNESLTDIIAVGNSQAPQRGPIVCLGIKAREVLTSSL